MNSKEIKHMVRMLPEYRKFLDANMNSFIARIYGIFTITIDKFSDLHVMIMQNTLPDVKNSEILYLFDLKGSTINRAELKNVDTMTLK